MIRDARIILVVISTKTIKLCVNALQTGPEPYATLKFKIDLVLLKIKFIFNKKYLETFAQLLNSAISQISYSDITSHILNKLTLEIFHVNFSLISKHFKFTYCRIWMTLVSNGLCPQGLVSVRTKVMFARSPMLSK